MNISNPLTDIRHYAPTLTISQVLKFCEKKELGITRGMIQNYIRDGLLPPPVNKRQYTHNHLAALVLIDRLKTVFDIPTIQAVLVPLMDEYGIPVDDYFKLIDKLEELTQKWEENISPILAQEDDGGMFVRMVFAAELKRFDTSLKH